MVVFKLLLVAFHKPLVLSLITPFNRIEPTELNLLAFWHRLVFSAQSLHSGWGLKVRTLGRPVWNLNSLQIELFLYHFWWVFGVTVLLEHPTVSISCSSDQRPFLHMTLSLSIWSEANFSWAFRCHRWRASFLYGSLSGHGDVKHTWLWTLTQVFQELWIHYRTAFWRFLANSVSQKQVIAHVFFLIMAVTWVQITVFLLRSLLNDFGIVVFVAESECIKWALFQLGREVSSCSQFQSLMSS